MQVNLIVAVNADYYIGKDNKLLTNCKEDMKFFKAMTATEKSVVIMGNNTFKSLPQKHLRNRLVVVLTKSKPQEVPNGVWYVESLEEALKVANSYPNRPVFIAGGEQVYNLFLEEEKTGKYEIASLLLTTFPYDKSEGDVKFTFEPERWKYLSSKKLCNTAEASLYTNPDVLQFDEPVQRLLQRFEQYEDCNS